MFIVWFICTQIHTYTHTHTQTHTHTWEPSERGVASSGGTEKDVGKLQLFRQIEQILDRDFTPRLSQKLRLWGHFQWWTWMESSFMDGRIAPRGAGTHLINNNNNNNNHLEEKNSILRPLRPTNCHWSFQSNTIPRQANKKVGDEDISFCEPRSTVPRSCEREKGCWRMNAWCFRWWFSPSGDNESWQQLKHHHYRHHRQQQHQQQEQQQQQQQQPPLMQVVPFEG